MVINESNIFDKSFEPVRRDMDRTDSRFTPLESCWICDSRSLRKVLQDHMDLAAYMDQDEELSRYTGSTFWLVRCADCGFMQPDVLPRLENFFVRMYDQRWSDDWLEQEFNNGCKDFIFRGMLKQLSRLTPRGSNRKLLDIGAHVGRLMYLSREAGWQAEGVEVNPRTSAHAIKRTTLPVHRVDVELLIEDNKKYNAVTMMDVLEHIPDPIAMLRKANELLTDGGWIVVKVPCGPSQLLKERIRIRLHKEYSLSLAGNMVHVNHFSPFSLRRALKSAGFTDIKLFTGAPELSPTNSRLSVRSLLSDAIRLGVYGLARIVPGATHTPLALNLQAYAQKKDSKREDLSPEVII